MNDVVGYPEIVDRARAMQQSVNEAGMGATVVPVPPADGPPPITDIDDIITQQAVADFFGVTIATVRDYMSGRRGTVPLPYVRPGGGTRTSPRFSKRQIAWWLRKTQEQVDPSMVDVRRAQRLLGTQR